MREETSSFGDDGGSGMRTERKCTLSACPATGKGADNGIRFEFDFESTDEAFPHPDGTGVRSFIVEAVVTRQKSAAYRFERKFVMVDRETSTEQTGRKNFPSHRNLPNTNVFLTRQKRKVNTYNAQIKIILDFAADVAVCLYKI